MLEQGKRIANDLVEVGFTEGGSGGAGEVEQAVGNLGSAEGLLCDFFENRAQALVALELLCEHLCVGGDDRQGGIDQWS